MVTSASGAATAAHPARVAAQKSMDAVMAKDRAAWLAAYADDACIEDPVGPSWLDPTGTGHRGRAAIEAFYDNTIATTQAIRFEIADSFAAGSEVANVGTIHITLPDGQVARCEGVFVYGVDDNGLIRSLRAFWETDRMMATLG